MKIKSLRWLNTISFAATIVINALANLIPLGIGPTGAISEKYPNLFTPAPVTFAIWGVIYLMMALFLLWQWGVWGSKHEAEADLCAVGVWFAVSCALNIAWVFAWHYDVIPLSVLLIALLLVSLAVIGKRLRKTVRTGLRYFALNAGFDLYFGWIIAAVLSNISVFLVSVHWNGFGLSPVFWTCIVLSLGAIIGSLPTLKNRQWYSTIAVIWAYIGILIRHIGQNGYAGKYPIVIGFTALGIVLMLGAIALRANKKNRR